MNPTSANRRVADAGFTLLEVTVVLGLLMSFMLFLTSLLRGGVQLFDEGERGQALTDIAQAAAVSTRDTLEQMVGPRREYFEPTPPDARLVVQWIPLGLRSKPSAEVQAIRATVRITDDVEVEMLRALLYAEAEATARSRSDDDVAARLEELVQAAPRMQRATLLLMPWNDPADRSGQLMEVRIARFYPGEVIALDRRREIDPVGTQFLEDIPTEVIEPRLEAVAKNLLFVGFELVAPSVDPEASSFERKLTVWDSARAGWFLHEEASGRKFSYDRGESSWLDTTDDVFPRAIDVTLVVAGASPPARLAEPVAGDGDSMRVVTVDPLPDTDEIEFLKVGSEWIRVGAVRGNRLTGVQRGQRSTAAVDHDVGTPVRAGKTLRMRIELPFGKDAWGR